MSRSMSPSTPSPTGQDYPHTSKLLILFPSPGGKGVRGEGRNLCNINRLAHTLKPPAFWSRTCVDTYSHRETCPERSRRGGWGEGISNGLLPARPSINEQVKIRQCPLPSGECRVAGQARRSILARAIAGVKRPDRRPLDARDEPAQPSDRLPHRLSPDSPAFHPTTLPTAQ